MSEINIKVSAKIAENRQLISQIGSNLGQQFHKVEVREVWQGGREGFENDKKAILTGTKTGFILNRSPRKAMLKSYEIESTKIMEDPITNEIGIAVNLKADGTYDMFVPIDPSSLGLGKGTVDAVSAALRGEGNHFFLDPEMVTRLINEKNKKEVSHLENLKLVIDKMIQNLNGTIAENERKAKTAHDEWVKSAIPASFDPVHGGTATATIEIHPDE